MHLCVVLSVKENRKDMEEQLSKNSKSNAT